MQDWDSIISTKDVSFFFKEFTEPISPFCLLLSNNLSQSKDGKDSKVQRRFIEGLALFLIWTFESEKLICLLTNLEFWAFEIFPDDDTDNDDTDNFL